MVEAIETTVDQTEVSIDNPSIVGMLPALRRLDRLIERALNAAQAAYGPEAAADPFRGLHITPEEVERLLLREPGVPVLAPTEVEPSEESHGDGDYADARLI